jgi:TolB-like protein
MTRWLEEIRRRRVARVAVVYAATAFVVLQAADLLASGLALPGWVFSAITVLVIAGFPLAVVLGWAFDLTPEGVRVTRPAPPSRAGAVESLPALLGRRTALISGLLVVLGVGLGAGWFLRPLPEAYGGASGLLPVGDATDARSLAVLRFVDLSESGDQKWFADGLAEEILTSLSRLPELRVIGRNSSFLFTADAGDDQIVAGNLGVAHLVKGSVTRVGGRLRVSAQLVRAADGVQLWSESYDRRDDDLLDVQRDVAEKVAAALDVLLDDARRERMFAAGTRNVEAFEAYVRGREIHIAARYTFKARHD